VIRTSTVKPGEVSRKIPGKRAMMPWTRMTQPGKEPQKKILEAHSPICLIGQGYYSECRIRGTLIMIIIYFLCYSRETRE
jgi:hypothetical protein